VASSARNLNSKLKAIMSDVQPKHGALYTSVMHFVGGVFGGMTGVAASYPLDTVKGERRLGSFSPLLMLLCARNATFLLLGAHANAGHDGHLLQRNGGLRGDGVADR
jgi:hypothetical protein